MTGVGTDSIFSPAELEVGRGAARVGDARPWEAILARVLSQPGLGRSLCLS